MTSEDRTWRTSRELGEHAQLLIALVGTRSSANESTVAAALATSTRHLQRALLEAGTTFRAEQLKTRMRRAERLLAEDEQSLAAVAARCGYAHAPAFTRAFKQQHDGMTPRMWRKRRPDTARASRPQGELGVLLRGRFHAVVSRVDDPSLTPMLRSRVP